MSGRRSKFGPLAGALSARKGAAAPPSAKKVGKSRDKERYVQTTAYIDRSLHEELQVELVRARQEYSQLVEDLLRKWLKGRSDV